MRIIHLDANAVIPFGASPTVILWPYSRGIRDRFYVLHRRLAPILLWLLSRCAHYLEPHLRRLARLGGLSSAANHR